MIFLDHNIESNFHLKNEKSIVFTIQLIVSTELQDVNRFATQIIIVQ